jgi:peptide/nickel transport system substrate-binding protein
MRQTVERKRLTHAAAFVAVLVLALAGCGGGHSHHDTPNPTHVDLYGGKPGGTATFVSGSDVDFVDPGLTYYQLGSMVEFAVNRALYQFTPDGGTMPVNDLADRSPQISQDHRTITVHLKAGVHYAPPVNREVTSADVKYAIERAFTTNVRSPYARTYFGTLEGAPDHPVPMVSLKSFPGLQTPDRRTLVLRLKQPVAERVAAALVMPITVPVPREYATRFDRHNPSTYDDHVAFTGPYRIAADKTGRLTGRNPGRRIRLVRNPNWSGKTDFRPAYLNKITIDESDADDATLVRRTLSGHHLLCCDQPQLPRRLVRRALTRFPRQVGSVAAGGTRWVALNMQVAPFDNLNVRRAVVAAFDREALRRTRGPDRIGAIATGYLPPGVQGFDQSGGDRGFKDLDFMQHPRGDMALARKYMLAARRQGVPVTPQGTYAGHAKLLAASTTTNPGRATASEAQRQLERLGFRLHVRLVPDDVLFRRFCGVQRARVAVCFNAAWFKDFPDPEEMLRPMFSGDGLGARRTTNWSELDDQAIDAKMGKASLLAGSERADAWADVNRAIVEQAPGVPYLWDESFQVSSVDLEAVMNPFSATWDLSYTRVK